MEVTTIGLDLAKHWFQVHGINNEGSVIVRKRLRRAEVLGFFAELPPCLVGIEACATAHHWARQIARAGHQVKLMPPAYVKAYVRRGKNDANDAEAICEAVRRPNMRFVAVKGLDQQAFLMLHRSRELLVRQRSMSACAIRAHLVEFGIIAPQGRHRVDQLAAYLEGEEGKHVPLLARETLRLLIDQLGDLSGRIATLEAELAKLHRIHPIAQLLSTIPGVGPITSTALVATVPDPSVFRSGREFAAWIGLTPRQNSSGGKERLGRITKRGDVYLRHLLVIGARNIVRFPKARAMFGAAWIDSLLGRRRPMVVAVAVANKMARIIWAMMTTGECYRRASAG
jgi:transposase